MSTAAATEPTTDIAAALRRAYRRVCGAPARTRWAVGFGGAAVGVAAASVLGRPTADAGVLVWVLAVAVVTDLLWRRIFNAVLGPALLTLAGLHALAAAGVPVELKTTAAEAAAGLAVCSALMLALYLSVRGGEGDVKLVAVVGAAVGPWHGVEAAVAGYLLAAAVAVGLVAVRAVLRVASRDADRRPLFAGTLPMAPFFAAGVLFTLGW